MQLLLSNSPYLHLTLKASSPLITLSIHTAGPEERMAPPLMVMPMPKVLGKEKVSTSKGFSVASEKEGEGILGSYTELSGMLDVTVLMVY